MVDLQREINRLCFDFALDAREVLAAPRGEVVEDADAAAFANKTMNEVGTDEAGSAGNQKFSHRGYLPRLRWDCGNASSETVSQPWISPSVSRTPMP